MHNGATFHTRVLSDILNYICVEKYWDKLSKETAVPHSHAFEWELDDDTLELFSLRKVETE